MCKRIGAAKSPTTDINALAMSFASSVHTYIKNPQKKNIAPNEVLIMQAQTRKDNNQIAMR